MGVETRPSPRLRSSRREWLVVIGAALLLHVLILFVMPARYLAVFRSTPPDVGETGDRVTFFDNPFRVIPLAPESGAPRYEAAPSRQPAENAGEPMGDVEIGEPTIEVLPMPGGGGGPRVGPGSRGATVQPKPLYIPWPKYPKGIREVPQGSVELAVLVNEKGEVEDVKITRSLPVEELNRVAVEAARAIRFVPGMERGVRTPMWVRLAIGFQPR